MIHREHQSFKDILQIDFEDSYYGLTTKVITSFRWASTSCKIAHFVFRVNDDIAVSTPMLIKYLKKLKNETISDSNLDKIILGHLYTKSPIFRGESDKFYVSHEEYSQKMFYPFTEGFSWFSFFNLFIMQR
jgi:hypothetical protein